MRIISDEAEMVEFGHALAAQLRPGDLILLDGPLGAGKTTLARGIGEGLGLDSPVTSPTFVISRVHSGALPLIHVDVYRLLDATEGAAAALDDLDLDSERAESVTLMEWGRDVGPRLSDEFLLVCIDRLDDDRREVILEAHGTRWQELRI
ncbi:MAG TPA: tRNA (adenosine(37)-N6)-threonylcarbamoyltransferase complex ATPase subunit type 1 TsaE [Candidatus Nanopelagicaceae bacterium]|nr:tRNA (adenosine(37)-N6)-threonylcarbamoyltransferase complex ATPase subunit type 1 TsaE [Candidatus Nanopelagicaceae bacterium]